jgi:hypothetical protein
MNFKVWENLLEKVTNFARVLKFNYPGEKPLLFREISLKKMDLVTSGPLKIRNGDIFSEILRQYL